MKPEQSRNIQYVMTEQKQRHWCGTRQKNNLNTPLQIQNVLTYKQEKNYFNAEATVILCWRSERRIIQCAF